jgi:hypothetical protein
MSQTLEQLAETRQQLIDAMRNNDAEEGTHGDSRKPGQT